MKGMFATLLTLGMLVGCQTTQSPTGRSQMLMFSDAEMRQLGERSFEQIRTQEKTPTSPRVKAYVNCVADAITRQLPSAAGPTGWEVEVFDSEQVNAFALPGGHIGVYSGLLKVAETPHQLAAVIGHEVGHVLARHSNERLSRNQLTELGMNAAGAFMDIGGVESRNAWMSALGVGTQVGILLPYGRKQESESDEIGLELMANAGFDPRQSVTLWLRMGRASQESKTVELLSTHPSHSRRIQELNARMPRALELYEQAQRMGIRPSCKK